MHAQGMEADGRTHPHIRVSGPAASSSVQRLTREKESKEVEGLEQLGGWH